MGIRAEYLDRLQSGELKQDPAQSAVVDRLEELARQLERCQSRRNGLFSKLLGNGNSTTPGGLYVWGAVGCGKTMLMDEFFANAPMEPKRRAHFHAFMQDVHSRLHRTRKSHKSGEAIAAVAQEIAAEARLLCLDEMQISDIADAMIVGRLFEYLFDLGVVVVMTSNFAPGDLYRDGLNRGLFLPFICLIEERLEIVELASSVDYRLGRIRGQQTFITPLGPAAEAKMQDLWEKLTDTVKGQATSIEVLGRRLAVPEAAHGAARFGFHDLCEAPLGPADYLAVAGAFKLVFVENIPALSAAERNAAKRFVLLIDTLYDARARLVASAEVPPAAIYPGRDHRLEFARTMSRLEEMQSAAWWGARIAET